MLPFVNSGFVTNKRFFCYEHFLYEKFIICSMSRMFRFVHFVIIFPFGNVLLLLFFFLPYDQIYIYPISHRGCRHCSVMCIVNFLVGANEACVQLRIQTNKLFNNNLNLSYLSFVCVCVLFFPSFLPPETKTNTITIAIVIEEFTQKKNTNV